MENYAVWGLIGLAGATFIWVIYHAAKAAGKAEAKTIDATTELHRVVEEENYQDDLEQASRDAADRAIRAGLNADSAPDDPERLPDAVRARILKP